MFFICDNHNFEKNFHTKSIPRHINLSNLPKWIHNNNQLLLYNIKLDFMNNINSNNNISMIRIFSIWKLKILFECFSQFAIEFFHSMEYIFLHLLLLLLLLPTFNTDSRTQNTFGSSIKRKKNYGTQCVLGYLSIIVRILNFTLNPNCIFQTVTIIEEKKHFLRD